LTAGCSIRFVHKRAHHLLRLLLLGIGRPILPGHVPDQKHRFVYDQAENVIRWSFLESDMKTFGKKIKYAYKKNKKRMSAFTNEITAFGKKGYVWA
jgi:hypothetical protein